MMDAIILPRLRFPRARGQQPPPAAREEGRSDAETGLTRDPWSPGPCDTRPSRPEGTQTRGAPFPRTGTGPRVGGGWLPFPRPHSRAPRGPSGPRARRAHRSGGAQVQSAPAPAASFPAPSLPAPAPRPPPTCVYSAATAMSGGAWAARGRDGATRGAGPAALGPREVAVRGAASAAQGRPAAEVSCGSTNFPEGCGPRREVRIGPSGPTPRRDWPGRGRGRARPSPVSVYGQVRPPAGERPSENQAERAALSRPQGTGVSQVGPAQAPAPLSRCLFTVKSRRT